MSKPLRIMTMSLLVPLCRQLSDKIKGHLIPELHIAPFT